MVWSVSVSSRNTREVSGGYSDPFQKATRAHPMRNVLLRCQSEQGKAAIAAATGRGANGCSNACFNHPYLRWHSPMALIILVCGACHGFKHPCLQALAMATSIRKEHYK